VSVKRSEAFQPAFEGFMHSFRPLTQSERAGIREHRLRLVKASQGETLEALVVVRSRAGASRRSQLPTV
jgi:predicted Zn-dependent protease